MLKKITQNKYLLILIIIVIILIIIKIISSSSTNNPPLPTETQPGQSSKNPLSNPNSNSSLQNSDSPSNQPPSNSNPSANRITEINYQIPLYNFLPYQGKYFSAHRYLEANNLEIIVSRQDQTDLAKQEAQDWLTKNGVDQLDRFTVIYK